MQTMHQIARQREQNELNYSYYLAQIPNPRDFLREQVKLHKGKLSTHTKLDYQKKVRRLEALRKPDGTPPDITSISGTSRTFYAYRAAFIWDAVQRGKSAMNARDKAQKTGDYETVENMNRVIKQSAVDLYVYSVGDGLSSTQQANLSRLGLSDDVIPSSYKVAKKEGRTPQPRHGSMKKTTNAIMRAMPNDDWRDRLWNRLTKLKSPWLTYAAVASLTGCRPTEIEGVQVAMDNAGGLIFTIEGAKTNDGHGQPVRVLTLCNDPPRPEFAHLYKLAPFEVKAPEVSNPSNAFTKALERASRASFTTKAPLMSPYVYRHALASDLKADATDPAQIAQVLGHSVERTQRFYGHTASGTKGNRCVCAIGNREVRTHKPERKTVVKTQQFPTPNYTSDDFTFSM